MSWQTWDTSQTNTPKGICIIAYVPLGRKREHMKRKTKFTKDLIDTPLFNEKDMDMIYWGIAQNVYVEMDKQGFSIRELGNVSGVNYSHLTKIFNGQGKMGLSTLIKISYALHMNPKDFFPFDDNGRKTNGQRFEELTKELDTAGINYLMNICTDYIKERRRIIRKANQKIKKSEPKEN